MAGIALEIRQVMRAVSCSIPLETVELSDEFFPAHLPVALIDAVFGCRLRDGEQSALVAARYCRHFGIARTRANRLQPPPSDDQETLGDLIRHYDELGAKGMADEVFRANGCFPGTKIPRAQYVLRLAQELQRIGIGVLQDVRVWRRKEIDVTLRTMAGVDEHIVRMLLTCTGDDDFVWGDVNVRQFIASAIGRNTISATRAVNLVRRTAYELVLSPRYLGHEIWRCGACLSK